MWRSLVSAIVVIAVGSLLHFAWEWSGRSAVVAVFAATNESTWEHLKLAFWPALALAPLQHGKRGRRRLSSRWHRGMERSMTTPPLLPLFQ